VSLRGQDTPTLPLAGLRVGPFSRTAVVGAPFSAVATTVVIRRNPDGTRVQLMGTWRVYRDSNGRVRVDWVAPAPRGQAGAGTSTQKMSVLKLGDGRDEGGHPLVYIVDSVRRTFRALGGMSAGTFFNAETTFAIPTGVTSLGAPTFYMFLAADVHATNGAARQSLGQARIEGLEADGGVRRSRCPARAVCATSILVCRSRSVGNRVTCKSSCSRDTSIAVTRCPSTIQGKASTSSTG
jgi:hypothetical protein